MIIRKIRKNGILNGKKLIKRAIILVIALIAIKGIQYFNNRTVNEISRITSMQVNDSVSLSGYLAVDNNFPYYTHSIIDSNKDKIGLKSASINLNKYKGKVEIIGKIESFVKLVPIVEVETLKLPEQGLIIKNNTYYFTKDFLYLDFSNQPQLSAIKSGNDVVVLFADKPVVNSERFLCAAIVKKQTCEALISGYVQSKRDNFDSTRGYTYYKHGTGVRDTFDGDSFGYVFKNIEDSMMVDLSSMIRIVNKDFILENKIMNIQGSCKDSNQHLQTVNDAKMKYVDSLLITLSLTGLTNIGEQAMCTIIFDTRNERNVKSALFTPTGA